jgi:very-short-patch-repair endonuclease
VPSPLTPLAKSLRENSTDAERLLWQHLRARQAQGLKFRRQQPIGNYIVDFVCFDRKLIIELDGGQHAEQQQTDDARTQWLETQGFTVIRFWNNEVLQNLEGVWQAIVQYCPPTPADHHEIPIP